MREFLAGARPVGELTLEKGKPVIACSTPDDREAIVKAVKAKVIIIAVPPKKQPLWKRVLQIRTGMALPISVQGKVGEVA